MLQIGTIGGNLFLKHFNNEFQSDVFLLFETVGAMITIGMKYRHYHFLPVYFVPALWYLECRTMSHCIFCCPKSMYIKKSKKLQAPEAQIGSAVGCCTTLCKSSFLGARLHLKRFVYHLPENKLIIIFNLNLMYHL